MSEDNGEGHRDNAGEVSVGGIGPLRPLARVSIEEAPQRPAPTLPPGRKPGPGWRLAAGARAGIARGFLFAWPIWERIKQRLEPVMLIPDAPHSLFLVHFGRYHGRPITLPDGTTIARGDVVCELHLNNRKLVAATGGNAELLGQLRGDLRALAAWARRPDFPSGARALFGFTLMSPGARRLGFITRDRPLTLKVRLDRFFLVGLLALYNRRGVERLRHGTTYRHYPREIWMSRDELVRRYGTAGESPVADRAEG